MTEASNFAGGRKERDGTHETLQEPRRPRGPGTGSRGGLVQRATEELDQEGSTRGTRRSRQQCSTAGPKAWGSPKTKNPMKREG